jgi:hypothetical protein
VVIFYFLEVNRHMLEELIAALEDKELAIRCSPSAILLVGFSFNFSVVILIAAKVFQYINNKFNPQAVSLLKDIIIFSKSHFFERGIYENSQFKIKRIDAAVNKNSFGKILENV